MLILPHPSLFRCSEDAEYVISSIRKRFNRHNLLHVGSTRFYGNHKLSCCSTEVFKCILLALLVPLVTIKQCDIDYAFEEELVPISDVGPGLPSISRVEALHAASSIDNPSYSAEPYTEGQDTTVEVPLSIDMSTCQPLVEPPHASQQSTSSQSTIICNQIDIDAELLHLDRLRDMKDSLRYDLPRTSGIKPRDDPQNLILNDTNFFLSELTFLASVYDLPAKISSLVDIDLLIDRLGSDFSGPSRLIIIPTKDIEGIVLILIDKQAEEWGLINPNAASQRELTSFSRIKSILGDATSLLKCFKGAQIDIPCHFHSDYRMMHLLMSVYCLCQAFRYAQLLPKRLTYTERRLRCLCYVICRELQFRNANYNFENGLVNDNGFLKEGAFRCLPSPVYFERSVVATDRCLFCDTRYLKNLGAHMSMAHGGQAKSKRDRRHWKDSL